MTPFYFLSGGGNDFVALTEPPRLPTPPEIRALCRRGISIGADGLFVLRRRTPGVELSHWNADGSPADLCLNGTRCAARLALDLGWADEEVELHTPAGRLRARAVGDDRISVAVPEPASDPEPEAELPPGAQAGWRVLVGVPHLVLVWARPLPSAPVAGEGPHLRRPVAGWPDGANVHWVALEPPSRFALRSFERGVEGETLACGTGVLAAALVGCLHHGLRFPLVAATAGGFALAVDGTVEGGRIRAWSLAGDARLLARGELLPAALLPGPGTDG